MKKIIICIISLILAFSLTACSTSGLFSEVKGSGIVTSGKSIPDEAKGIELLPGASYSPEYTEVASNGVYKLWYDSNNCAIRITDATGTKTWDSTIDTSSGELNMSSNWKQNVSSMFEINYSHPNENGRERIVTASVRKLKATVWSEITKSGITVQYYFPDRLLGFKAEFSLSKTGFTVNIPAESIIENGDYRFVSINVMPYFSAASANENGYILSPHSGGALLTFSSETQGKYIRLPIYSESDISPHESYKLNAQATQEIYTDSNVCSLPVMGMKNGDKGFVAYADQFGEDSYINLSTAYYGIPYNRVSFCCYIRNVSTLSFSGASDVSDGTADILDNDIIPTDKKICYDLLSGDECDYNVMAEKYRNHLVSSGLLNENSDEKADISVEIMMGVPCEEIAGNSLVKTTTFPQAHKIVEELYEKGIKNVLINLKGWNKNGYGASPTETKIAGSLGSLSELKDLAKYCEKIGYKMILESDYTELNTDFSNLSAKKVAVVDNNGFYITNTSENIYYLQLPVIQKRVSAFIKCFTDTGISGVNFNGFGSLLYRDYHDTITYSNDFSSGISKLLKDANDEFSTVAIRGTNLYALLNSNYAYDADVPFSGNIIYSDYIPFMQLVLRKSVGLMTDPVNTFYNPTLQELMQVEYNVIPNYELTYDSVYSLQNTSYNTLFSAKFDLWLDSISNQYSVKTDKLKDIADSVMINHSIIDKDIVLLSYENGKKLIINKTGSDYSYNGTNVPAYDFTVLN